MQTKLLKIYAKLLAYFGPQYWWPGNTPFEIMIGAILTQNTNWGNVERAILNLKKSKALNPGAILKIRYSKLEKLIRPSGYFRVKARKLKAFCRWLLKKRGVRQLKKFTIEELRPELLKVWGIGPETADSMLCYALDKIDFVIDAYTVRIFNRLGLIKTKGYHEIKEYFESHLPKNLELYKEYHALLVALGKDICKPKPLCGKCPLLNGCLPVRQAGASASRAAPLTAIIV